MEGGLKEEGEEEVSIVSIGSNSQGLHIEASIHTLAVGQQPFYPSAVAVVPLTS